jgi:UDP-N-acetylglucosamine transferase subunit ALG13
MIFVTVGTNEAPFDRLLRAVEGLSGAEELVVQHGASSYRPSGASCVPFLPFDALVEHVREASIVVTHAGVGSIAVALMNGKVPLVVPRRRSFGEAVDDHQVALAERLASGGLVVAVDEPRSLPEAVATFRREAQPPPETALSSALVDDLAAYLTRVIDADGQP